MEIKLLNDEIVFIKGKKESVLVNPKEKELKDSKLSARVVIFTNENNGKADLIGDRVLINGAGEYEIGGIEINGINGEDGNTVYRLVVDGFAIVLLGDLQQELTPKRVERIDSTDILIAPTKIGEATSFKLVKDWAKKWGANYLVPVSKENESLKLFLDAADEEGLEEVESLKIEKADELPDGLEVKLLKKLE
jgi:hypothetical protein